MNDLVTTNFQVPAHLAERVGSAVASDMTSGISVGGGFKRISIRGGRFRVRDGSEEKVLPGEKLRAIIVGNSAGVAKTFYKGTYNPKAEDKSPDCYSNDGVRPAKDANDPQSQLCATCEHNAWGSKITDSGARMKACADQKKLAIISADDTREEPEVYLFTVTPAALRGFYDYGKSLEAKGIPPELVITDISFDTNEAYPKVQFDFGGWVSKEMLPAVEKLVDSPKVNEITGKTTPVAKIEDKPEAVAYVAPKVEVEDAEFEEAKPVEQVRLQEEQKKQAAEEPKVAKSSALQGDILGIIAKMKEDGE